MADVYRTIIKTTAILICLSVCAVYFFSRVQFKTQIVQSTASQCFECIGQHYTNEDLKLKESGTSFRDNITGRATPNSVFNVDVTSPNHTIGNFSLLNNFSTSLVTVTESGQTTTHTESVNNSFQITVVQHEILWLNLPVWIDLNLENKKLSESCIYNNCPMTVNKSNVFSKSALIFSTQDGLSEDPLILQKQRSQNQVWVFMRMEPPTIYNPSWYSDTKWRNTMNWSMGYRLDSDVFWPYTQLPKRNSTSKVANNYHVIFQRKSKFAAWAVGNCGRREEFVNQLKKYGIPIDAFGKCSPNHQRVKDHELFDVINRDYKFYLAFENSLCKDYVTEKFFNYYELDTVLVVRGGINYSEHFVNETFIDASPFASAKELATFLLMVNRSEEVYTQYLRKKNSNYFNPSGAYTISDTPFCRLCKKLNNLEKSQVYNDIHSYIQNGTCSKPNDLS